MKIIFNYYENKFSNNLSPSCHSIEIASKYDSLAGYITDDASDPYAHSLFLQDVLIKARKGNECDLSSNNWGCELLNNEIFMFFMLDEYNEKYYVHIPAIEFIYVIDEWIKFINKPILDIDYKEIIDTEDAYK